MGLSAFDPALGLLSALTSLPAAFYYARAFGAAAVWPVRRKDGRISGLRHDASWTRALLVFLGATAVVSAALAAIDAAAGRAASEHAAFGTVLVAALWPQAPERIVRLLLVLLLLAAGTAAVVVGAESAASVVAGYAVGLCAAWALRAGTASPRREQGF